MAFGPGVRQEVEHVGRFGGELVEQVGEVGPRIDRVSFGAGDGGLRTAAVRSPPSPATKSQFFRPMARGRTARSALLLSMVKRASSR